MFHHHLPWGSHHWLINHSPGYASGSVFHPAVSHPQTKRNDQRSSSLLSLAALRPGNSISIADLTEVFQLLGSAHLRSQIVDDEKMMKMMKCQLSLMPWNSLWQNDDVFCIYNLNWDSKCEERGPRAKARRLTAQNPALHTLWEFMLSPNSA